MYGISLVFIVVFFLVPFSYYVVFPGVVVDLGAVVESGSEKNEHFFAISSSVYENPYSSRLGLTDNSFETNLFVLLLGIFRANVDVFQIPAGYETITTEQIKKYQYRLLNESLRISQQLAFGYLGVNNTVNVLFGELAGSSGSLMLTLEIINQLGDDDLIRRRTIAGTGELNESGHVIPVGSVQQKIRQAEKEGMDIIIIPADSEGVDSSITVISVGHLDDAVDSLN